MATKDYPFTCPACHTGHATNDEANECCPTATRYPNFNPNTREWKDTNAFPH